MLLRFAVSIPARNGRDLTSACEMISVRLSADLIVGKITEGPFGKLAGGKMMLRETEVGKWDLGRKQLRFCN